MPVQMTGFGPALMKLGMHMAVAAYRDDFSEFTGKMLAYNTTSDFEIACYYVYELNGSLWVAIRGSTGLIDFLSCAEFNETTTKLGTFHNGSYQAAVYVYANVKSYISSFTGTIYVAGHSYGGTVAPVLATLMLADFPDKDINALCYAPIPMMDNVTALKYKERMFSVVNDVDLVPTLSVPNLYNRLQILIPFFEEVDEAWLISYLESWLEDFWIFLPTDYYEALKEDIPAVVDAVLGYSHGEERKIRYPPGHVYQVVSGTPKKLADCEIDPVTQLDMLSISPWALLEHNAGAYEDVIDEMPDDTWFA
jgi:hypothetical protein